MKTKQIAALNISMLAAYEALYGPVPQDMVATIYDVVGRLDYMMPPENVIRIARQMATVWLGRMHQRSQTADSSTGKLPISGDLPPSAPSGKPGIAQPVRPLKKKQ